MDKDSFKHLKTRWEESEKNCRFYDGLFTFFFMLVIADITYLSTYVKFNEVTPFIWISIFIGVIFVILAMISGGKYANEKHIIEELFLRLEKEDQENENV